MCLAGRSLPHVLPEVALQRVWRISGCAVKPSPVPGRYGLLAMILATWRNRHLISFPGWRRLEYIHNHIELSQKSPKMLNHEVIML